MASSVEVGVAFGAFAEGAGKRMTVRRRATATLLRRVLGLLLFLIISWCGGDGSISSNVFGKVSSGVSGFFDLDRRESFFGAGCRKIVGGFHEGARRAVEECQFFAIGIERILVFFREIGKTCAGTNDRDRAVATSADDMLIRMFVDGLATETTRCRGSGGEEGKIVKPNVAAGSKILATFFRSEINWLSFPIIPSLGLVGAVQIKTFVGTVFDCDERGERAAARRWGDGVVGVFAHANVVVHPVAVGVSIDLVKSVNRSAGEVEEHRELFISLKQVDDSINDFLLVRFVGDEGEELIAGVGDVHGKLFC